jgi:hypothetical protein
MKTREQYLEALLRRIDASDLPDEVKFNAMFTLRLCAEHNNKAVDLRQNGLGWDCNHVGGAFFWDLTVEGTEYWGNVDTKSTAL